MNINAKIEGQTIIIYLGDSKENLIENKQFLNSLSTKYNLNNYDEIEEKIGEEKYKFYTPYDIKPIKVIDKNGKQYKCDLTCTKEIKYIISALEMKNPCFKDNDKYIHLDIHSLNYFFCSDIYEIKDMVTDIDKSQLENNYKEQKEKIEIYRKNTKGKLLLNQINNKIASYSRKYTDYFQPFYFTKKRRGFFEKIKYIFWNQKINIYGIYGNYASGKSFTLLGLNFFFEYPTIYLNLKTLSIAYGTQGFYDIVFFELLNYYIKSGISFDNYYNDINNILNISFNDIGNFIEKILQYLKGYELLVILDQFKTEYFSIDILNYLKNISNDINSNLKILLVCSLDDSNIRDEYIKRILNPGAKFEIPFEFINPLISENDIKNEISLDKKEIKEPLKKFSNLSLYHDLLTRNILNIDKFITEVKEKIKNKINSFLQSKDNQGNVEVLESIRKSLDNEIDIQFFKDICNGIPFKYFYALNINNKIIIRVYFPLIKEIWEDIIVEKTSTLLNGEIKEYSGTTIGSFLELNFKKFCKNYIEIDVIVKVDTIYEMKKIIEKESNEFDNKNIFIIQENENGKSFDFALFENKNEKRLCFIQVKKSFTKNFTIKEIANERFNANKSKFKIFFGSEPNECSLVYISLINNEIKKSFKNYKNIQDKKEKKCIYKIKNLINKCKEENIDIYFLNPSEKRFYINYQNDFNLSQLNLFNQNFIPKKNIFFETNINYNFETILNRKRKEILDLNSQYLEKKLNNNAVIKDKNGFCISFDKLYNFINSYWVDGIIVNCTEVIDNDFTIGPFMEKKIAIIGLIKKRNELEIESFIYKNNIYKNANNKINSKITNLDDISLDEKGYFSNYSIFIFVQFTKFRNNLNIYSFDEN